MNTDPQLKESGLLRLKFETLDTSRGEFEGYGAVFGNVDSHGDIIEPGAFAASITHHKSSGTAPVMLWSHKADEPVGRWISLKEDTIGLLVRGRINLASSRGRDAHAHITGGDVTGLSIGYRRPEGWRGLRCEEWRQSPERHRPLRNIPCHDPIEPACAYPRREQGRAGRASMQARQSLA